MEGKNCYSILSHEVIDDDEGVEESSLSCISKACDRVSWLSVTYSFLEHMIWNLRLVSLVFVPFVIEIQSRSTNLPLKIHWPSYYFLVSSYFLVSHMLHLSIQPQTIDQNIIHTGLVWESGVLCTPY